MRFTVVAAGAALFALSASSAGCTIMRTTPAQVTVAVERVRGSPLPSLLSGIEVDANEVELDEDGLAEDAVRLCEDKSPALAQATRALRDLGSKIDALDNAANPIALTDDLHALLETPCFALAKLDAVDVDDLVFESGLAFKTWWRDGRQWLSAYIELNHRGMSIPGSPREALFLDTQKDHPLAPLLCPASDATAEAHVGCGQETVGWMRRAEASLERRHAHDPSPDWKACFDKAKATSEVAGRYATYVSCMSEAIASHEALPLGRFRSPNDGFLVIDGGDHNTSGACEELHIFDLATGAAHVALGCVGGAITLKTGRLPVATLREAAFMLMLSQTKQDHVRGTQSFTVPVGIKIARPRVSEGLSSLWGMSGCGSSDQTEYRWSWMRAKNGVLTGQVSGDLITSVCASELDDHVGELLAIADDAVTFGCAPSPPPRMTIRFDHPGPSLQKNVSIDLDRVETEPLRRALATARNTRICPTSP